ncbi:MAG TPA: histidine phosphatase family protein [Feifaniaceae bacterium]|nr:histidine phosphatase family protein [Feifaniaceae bacterium]
MNLLLMRHGQTEWNHTMRTQGRTDIPLDETGRAQAALAAERLKDARLDAVYASPLLRARQTAEAVAGPHGLPVIEHPLLVERDFGIWEGEEFSALANKYPDALRLWREDPVACTPENAESLTDVLHRCTAFLEELRARHGEEETVLVVSHSIPLRLMVAHLIGLAPGHIHSLRMDNAAYTELLLREKYNTLLVLNDTGHL